MLNRVKKLLSSIYHTLTKRKPGEEKEDVNNGVDNEFSSKYMTFERCLSSISRYLDYEYLFEKGKDYGLNNVKNDKASEFIGEVAKGIIESMKNQSYNDDCNKVEEKINDADDYSKTKSVNDASDYNEYSNSEMPFEDQVGDEDSRQEELKKIKKNYERALLEYWDISDDKSDFNQIINNLQKFLLNEIKRVINFKDKASINIDSKKGRYSNDSNNDDVSYKDRSEKKYDEYSEGVEYENSDKKEEFEDNSPFNKIQKLVDEYRKAAESVLNYKKEIDEYKFSRSLLKTRIFIFIMLAGLFVGLGVELAFMSVYTGKALGIGTIYDSFERFASIISQSESREFWSSVIAILGGLVKICFVTLFSFIPFLFGFIFKFWLERFENEYKKNRLYEVALHIGLVLMVIYSAVLGLVVGESFNYEKGLYAGLLSLGTMYVIGLIMHNLVKTYAGYKQVSKKGLLFGSKWSFVADLDNYQKKIMNEKRGLKVEDYEGFANTSDKENKKRNEKSLKIIWDKIEVDSFKNAFLSGYDYGQQVNGKGVVNEDYLKSVEIEELLELEKRYAIYKKIYRQSEKREG